MRRSGAHVFEISGILVLWINGTVFSNVRFNVCPILQWRRKYFWGGGGGGVTRICIAAKTPSAGVGDFSPNHPPPGYTTSTLIWLCNIFFDFTIVISGLRIVNKSLQDIQHSGWTHVQQVPSAVLRSRKKFLESSKVHSTHGAEFEISTNICSRK